jgi:hypothetical protein
MTKEIDDMWEWLVESAIATDEEIQLVVSINGYNKQTLNEIYFARTGDRDIEDTMKLEE